MNKLFTKIATLSVGLALAVGVGVAVGQKSAKIAKAGESLVYTLDGTITGGSSGYDSESEINQSGMTWKAKGNTTMNPWRIGGKSLENEDRNIYSTTVMEHTISKIEITVGTSAVTVNSLTLVVSKNSDFSNPIESKAISFVASSTLTASPSAGKEWSDCYYKIDFNITITQTSNKFLQFISAKFYEETEAVRGDLEINDLSSKIIFVGDETAMSYKWTPASGDSATITSHTWLSSDSDVLSFSGDTFTALAPGSVTFTLTASDSNGQDYSIKSEKYYVSNEYSFEAGDKVAIYSPDAKVELSGINDGSSKYGTGVEYTSAPAGVFALEVETGTTNGSFAFKNGSNYLFWKANSNNSLDVSETKSENSSWYVVQYSEYALIINVAQATREIWWNNNSTGLRFACYEGKTPSSSGYKTISLAKIENVPVRGTISISTEFENPMRQGTIVNAQYSWTPAEGDDATIVSATWSSSDTAVFSVTGSTVEAVGAGKAKITLNATDSNGQEYVVSTSDITVVGVVSGDYEKKYSVSVGDTVTIVCEADGTQIAGIASNIGTYVFYDNAPDEVYDFTLEEGSQNNSYALANSEGKYLNWTSDAKLSLVDEIVDNSSWTIEIDGEGNAVIANVALDGEIHRYIAWNHNSPRFAPYKSGQTAVQLYGPAIVLDSSAIAFAQKIIDNITCDSDGKVAPSTSAWEALEEELKDVTAEGKEQLKIIHAIAHEDPATDREIVEEALAKYDYIVGKYGTSRYNDFLLREPSPISSGAFTGFETSIDSNNTRIIVVVIAATSAIALGALLLLKKRKQK